MPTHKQITVDAISTTRALGSSDTATLQSSFPASPIYAGTLTADTVLDLGYDLTDGTVNDGGHTFGTFSLDYRDAPNMADVKTGGGGLPGSPFVPAPGSPGPGSMNPADIPAPPSDFPADPGTEYGSGRDGTTSPSVTSAEIANQTIGSYIFGKSS